MFSIQEYNIIYFTKSNKRQFAVTVTVPCYIEYTRMYMQTIYGFNYIGSGKYWHGLDTKLLLQSVWGLMVLVY